MKLSVTRSSVLSLFAIAILLAALPDAIRRIAETRNPYLFTHQFFEDLLARLSGPGRLRFILQPTMALLVGIRDGIQDSHVQNAPFLSTLLFAKNNRKDLLRHAFRSTRDLLALAIILDVISQFLIFKRIHPGAALVLGPVLIATPYATARGVTNRIARTLLRARWT